MSTDVATGKSCWRCFSHTALVSSQVSSYQDALKGVGIVYYTDNAKFLLLLDCFFFLVFFFVVVGFVVVDFKIKLGSLKHSRLCEKKSQKRHRKKKTSTKT